MIVHLLQHRDERLAMPSQQHEASILRRLSWTDATDGQARVRGDSLERLSTMTRSDFGCSAERLTYSSRTHQPGFS